MFHFMKKDKEKDKEKKEKKKKEKEEKQHEKKEKREKKERQNMSQEEMNRLEDVKRSVFHRLSDRDKDKRHSRSSRASSHEDVPTPNVPVSKSDSSESFRSATSGSSASGAMSVSSSSREFQSSFGDGQSRPQLEEYKRSPERMTKPVPLPKPRGILKGKGEAPVSRGNLDDSRILQDNTRLNEEMSGKLLDQ